MEFKEAKNQFDFETLLSYCVALANERGGILLLGIENKPPRLVIGTNAYPNIVKATEDLFNKLRFRVDIEEVQHPDGRVLVFHIPSRPIGEARHLDGKYLMRSGESLVAMTPDQLKQIINEGISDEERFGRRMLSYLLAALLVSGVVLLLLKSWTAAHRQRDVGPTQTSTADVKPPLLALPATPNEKKDTAERAPKPQIDRPAAKAPLKEGPHKPPIEIRLWGRSISENSRIGFLSKDQPTTDIALTLQNMGNTPITNGELWILMEQSMGLACDCPFEPIPYEPEKALHGIVIRFDLRGDPKNFRLHLKDNYPLFVGMTLWFEVSADQIFHRTQIGMARLELSQ